MQTLAQYQKTQKVYGAQPCNTRYYRHHHDCEFQHSIPMVRVLTPWMGTFGSSSISSPSLLLSQQGNCSLTAAEIPLFRQSWAAGHLGNACWMGSKREQSTESFSTVSQSYQLRKWITLPGLFLFLFNSLL